MSLLVVYMVFEKKKSSLFKHRTLSICKIDCYSVLLAGSNMALYGVPFKYTAAYWPDEGDEGEAQVWCEFFQDKAYYVHAVALSGDKKTVVMCLDRGRTVCVDLDQEPFGDRLVFKNWGETVWAPGGFHQLTQTGLHVAFSEKNGWRIEKVHDFDKTVYGFRLLYLQKNESLLRIGGVYSTSVYSTSYNAECVEFDLKTKQ